MNDAVVMIGIPTYNGAISFFTQVACQRGGHPVAYQQIGKMSLLALNFNKILCDAVNLRRRGVLVGDKTVRLSHLVILHADVHPDDGWLKTMLEIAEQKRLHALSVILPIKTDEGLTTTGAWMGEPWPNGRPRRFTMKEVAELPATMTPPDIVPLVGNDKLLINTGCLLLDLAAVEWVWGRDPNRLLFTIEDHIDRRDTGFVARAFSEDWEFSLMLRREGLRYGATREVSARHWGETAWSNQQVWGWETDKTFASVEATK
jgi:hypothetical protein